MELTLEQAKLLCIKKWEYIVEHNGQMVGDNFGLLIDIPELKKYMFSCPYCELYFDNKCNGCLIKPDVFDNEECGCYQDNHPFIIWLNDQTKENAQAVLDLIKNN